MMKKKTCTILATGLCGLTLLIPAYGDVVGWYRMEGTSGAAISSVSNSSGAATVANASGDAFNYSSSVAGPFIYDPISDTTVANTSSMAFHGTTNDSFLTVTDGATSGPFDVADFTIEMFVKIDSVLTNYRPFVSHGGGLTSGWNVRSVISGNQYPSATISGANVFDTNDPIIDDGAWHHLAFVVQTSTPGSNFARLYMDGNLVREKTTSLDGYVANVSADFLIYAGDYVGNSDEVRFSNSALTTDKFLVAISEPSSLFLVLIGSGLIAGTTFVRKKRSHN